MENSNDKRIWKAFKNEKEEALSIIYYQNVDFLYFYGKKFTPDEELVLDVIHDLFTYLIQKGKRLDSAKNIRMYLLKSFRRRLFDELNKSRKKQKIENEYSIEPNIVFSVEEKLIFAEEESEKLKELKEGMKQLNAQQREVLYYKFTCGYDYNKICEIMSITNEAARQMVSRSIRSLKKYLNNKGLLFLLFFRRQRN